MDERRSGSLSGLTDQEAKEFHSIFMTSFFLFTLMSFIAHVLVAMLWRWPWFPNADGTYGSLVNGINYAATHLGPMLG